MKSFFRIKQVVNLFICLIIVSSLAITKHHELFGYSLKSEQKAETASNDTLRMFGNGRAEINTSVLASDIMGYGGKVPLKIVIRNGVVENIIALKNDETKEFFDNILYNHTSLLSFCMSNGNFAKVRSNFYRKMKNPGMR